MASICKGCHKAHVLPRGSPLCRDCFKHGGRERFVCVSARCCNGVSEEGQHCSRCWNQGAICLGCRSPLSRRVSAGYCESCLEARVQALCVSCRVTNNDLCVQCVSRWPLKRRQCVECEAPIRWPHLCSRCFTASKQQKRWHVAQAERAGTLAEALVRVKSARPVHNGSSTPADTCKNELLRIVVKKADTAQVADIEVRAELPGDACVKPPAKRQPDPVKEPDKQPKELINAERTVVVQPSPSLPNGPAAISHQHAVAPKPLYTTELAAAPPPYSGPSPHARHASQPVTSAPVSHQPVLHAPTRHPSTCTSPTPQPSQASSSCPPRPLHSVAAVAARPGSPRVKVRRELLDCMSRANEDNRLLHARMRRDIEAALHILAPEEIVALHMCVQDLLHLRTE